MENVYQDIIAWRGKLPKQTLIEIDSLKKRKPYLTLCMLFFYLSSWFTSAILLHRSPLLFIDLLLVIWIGFMIHGLGLIVHELVHNNIFNNRTFNKILCTIISVFIVMPYSAYQKSHWLHHLHSRTKDDPDETTNVSKNSKVLTLFSIIWIPIGVPLYLFFILPINTFFFIKNTKKERRKAFIEYLIVIISMSFLYFIFKELQLLQFLLMGWVLPIFISVSIIANLRSLAEHANTLKKDAIMSARTISSSKLMSLLFLNANYHREHHLFPEVPWHNLPQLRAILLPYYKDVNHNPDYKSYFSFFKDLLIHRSIDGLLPNNNLQLD